MNIKNRNLFRLTRFVLLKLPVLFKFFAKSRNPQKRLLIIKTDAIGDYILFRNFLELVKKSASFKDYQVDLLGNKLWQEIALEYDSSFISNFIFIDPDELYEAPLQTFKLGKKLFTNNYQTVLHPTSSRTFITDGLTGFTAAKHIIGFEGNTERINIKYKIKTDRFYTQTILLPSSIEFEFERSKYYFEQVLKENINIEQPYINTEAKTRHGIIIFPGSGHLKRNWGPENFLALIKLLLEYTPEKIYIAGVPDDVNTGNYLAGNLPAGSVNNLTGKTSLIELIELIGSANLIISNETSAVHIASALKTQVVCILGGGHFGRFVPYPPKMENIPLCLYNKMDCFNCNWNCIYKTANNGAFPCISTVSLQTVWNAVQPFL